MTVQPKQELANIEAFEEALVAYRPSSECIQLVQDNPPVLLVGPTAAGRNTLIDMLVQSGRYHFIVSDTTRKPRANNGVMEQDGVEYWFKTEQEFLQGLKDGAYLEAAIIHRQQVSGISCRELKEAIHGGKIPINEIEIEGAKSVYGFNKDAIFIFFLPPGFETWMERLRGRGNIDEEEIRRRLVSAINEIETALELGIFQFVINNEIHVASVAVDELANGREPDPEKQQKGQDHAEQLVVDIRLYLQGN